MSINLLKVFQVQFYATIQTILESLGDHMCHDLKKSSQTHVLITI